MKRVSQGKKHEREQMYRFHKLRMEIGNFEGRH